MKTALKIVVIAWIAVTTSTAFGQEWTKMQKEVWQVVEDSWAKTKAGDLNTMFGYIHDKYQGWNDQDPLPVNKAQVMDWFRKIMEVSKLDDYVLNPARITMTENAAVVDYYVWYKISYEQGDMKGTKSFKGKNAEFYVKEGGKWQLLGDMTLMKEDKEEK